MDDKDITLVNKLIGEWHKEKNLKLICVRDDEDEHSLHRLQYMDMVLEVRSNVVQYFRKIVWAWIAGVTVLISLVSIGIPFLISHAENSVRQEIRQEADATRKKFLDETSEMGHRTLANILTQVHNERLSAVSELKDNIKEDLDREFAKMEDQLDKMLKDLRDRFESEVSAGAEEETIEPISPVPGIEKQ